MKEPILDKYGHECTNRFARFLSNLTYEIKQMDDDAKMMPVNISMKRDSMGNGFGARLKKVFSVFKRKKK
mgnify:CR=1 FL=1